MGFRSKRGRPRLVKKGIDKGTPELQRHHAYGLTAEPLDLLLHLTLISEEEHRAGRRYRWLHTLLFGAPHISATAFDLFEGRTKRLDREEWRTRKEQEYKLFTATLVRTQLLEITRAICIYEETPAWLMAATQKLPYSPQMLLSLRRGLSLLSLL